MDITSSFESLKEQFGVVNWLGFSDVVEIPVGPFVPSHNQPMLVDIKTPLSVTPEYLFCYFSHIRHVKKNHDFVLENLMLELGEPKDLSDEKTYAHRWQEGDFALSIQSWPIEENLRMHATNVLVKKDPEHQYKTMISVENLTPLISTQHDINNILTIAKGFRQPEVRSSFDFSEFRNQPTGYAREIILKNEKILPDLERNHFLLWQTEKEVGFLIPTATFRVYRDLVVEFRHSILNPGKGPGKSQLVIKFRSDGDVRRVVLVDGIGPNDLDDMVIRLSKFWNFEFIFDEGIDND